VEDKINVTDADLMKYYEGHKADYLEPEKVVVTEISVTEEEKAKEIFQKVKDGADFTELAKEMDAKRESLGPGQGNEGKTRPFSKDSYSSAQNFAEAAFALEIGQMSDIIVQPIRDQTYYMIVRLDERIPERQKEFSEVEKSIRRTVEKQVKSDRMDRWLMAIKVEKKFQLYPDRIPVPVEAEVEETEEVEGVEGAEEVQEAEVTPETSDEQGTTDETADEEKTDSKEEESPSEDSEN
jgi:parvulin-like peptidyl-prolyl isomerase